jgi:hypothetical protein
MQSACRARSQLTSALIGLILKVAFLDATMNTLMDLYLSGHLSVTMKIRALECMKALCKAAHSKFMDPSAGMLCSPRLSNTPRAARC